MANGKWDLSFLYDSFEDPRLNKDVERIAAIAAEPHRPPLCHRR